MPSPWTDWEPLALRDRLSPAVLREILDGGQAFRWEEDAAGVWHGRWASQVIRLRLSPRNAPLQWSAPLALAADSGPALSSYLDAGRDARALADALPWRS